HHQVCIAPWGRHGQLTVHCGIGMLASVNVPNKVGTRFEELTATLTSWPKSFLPLLEHRQVLSRHLVLWIDCQRTFQLRPCLTDASCFSEPTPEIGVRGGVVR